MRNYSVCISYLEAKYLTDKGVFDKVHRAVSKFKDSLIKFGDKENREFKDFEEFTKNLRGNE